jgi:hypothetical protein
VSDWYCNINGQQYGPVAGEELIQWIQQGRIAALDLVWREGMGEWVIASSIPEFAGHFVQSGNAPPVHGASRPGARKYLRPHRGGAVLALGIIGLTVCCICGIIAWSMGNADLREMAAGRMDRSGEGMTQGGKICGMISVIINCVVAAIYLIMLIGIAASH